MFRAIIKKITFTVIPGPGNRLSSGVNVTTAKKIKTGRRLRKVRSGEEVRPFYSTETP